jgi:uncharacterized protein YuzE
MKAAMLEISFRKGRPLAAYLRLEGARSKSVRTHEAAPSLLVDYDAEGRALGIEVLAFDEATLARINDVLKQLGHAPLPKQELAPLYAA